MRRQLARWVQDVAVLARHGLSLRFYRGTLRGSSKRISLAFVGPGRDAPECRAFFERPPALSLRALVEPDVVFAAEPLPLLAQRVLHFHPFFDAVLDVARTVEDQIRGVRSKTHRRRLRQVSGSTEWAWAVGTRVADLEEFWNGLHRPYLQLRFGAQARLDPYRPLLERFERGGRVLTVRHRGEAVCGALLFDVPHGLSYDRNGFRADTLASPFLLANRTAALELAIFQLARERSHELIELGFCRAFLHDGLFTHKRRLGCRFVAARWAARYQLWVRPPLRPEFFARLPLVTGPCDDFEAHLGLPTHHAPMPRRRLRELLKNFSAPAVHRSVIWTDVAASDPKRKTFEAALRLATGARPYEVEEFHPIL